MTPYKHWQETEQIKLIQTDALSLSLKIFPSLLTWLEAGACHCTQFISLGENFHFLGQNLACQRSLVIFPARLVRTKHKAFLSLIQSCQWRFRWLEQEKRRVLPFDIRIWTFGAQEYAQSVHRTVFSSRKNCNLYCWSLIRNLHWEATLDSLPCRPIPVVVRKTNRLEKQPL